MKWAGNMARTATGEVPTAGPNRKKTLSRPGSRWEYTIKMALQEVGCGIVDWIDLSEDRERW